MLRQTKAKIELLWDIDQVLFVEKGIRGGLSYAGTRYAEREDGVNEIIYIDATNLVRYICTYET
jgi:hypothetical protein